MEGPKKMERHIKHPDPGYEAGLEEDMTNVF